MDNAPNIEGHQEAMRDLMKSMVDEDTDFATWEERFKEKKAKEEERKDIRSEVRPEKSEGNVRWLPGMDPLVPNKDPFTAIRYDTFDPPNEFLQEATKRGLAFTVGKSYPIYAELPEVNFGIGMRYITRDDNGFRRSVNSNHFNPPAKLYWDNLISQNVENTQDIRITTFNADSRTIENGYVIGGDWDSTVTW